MVGCSRRFIRLNRSISSSSDRLDAAEFNALFAVVKDICVGVRMDVVKLAKLSILGSVYVRLSISGAETLGRDETVLFGKMILITLITLKFSYNYYIYI